MNMDHWDEEDRELQEEFEDISTAWKKSAGPKKTPWLLDRQIRQQARYQLGDLLKESWIFGNIPLLTLVICLFFGLGLYFVVSLQYMQEDGNDESVDEPPTILNADDRKNKLVIELNKPPLKGWVRLSFRTNKNGLAEDIEVVDRCYLFNDVAQCVSSGDMEDYPDKKFTEKMDQRAVKILEKKKFQPYLERGVEAIAIY